MISNHINNFAKSILLTKLGFGLTNPSQNLQPVGGQLSQIMGSSPPTQPQSNVTYQNMLSNVAAELVKLVEMLFKQPGTAAAQNAAMNSQQQQQAGVANIKQSESLSYQDEDKIEKDAQPSSQLPINPQFANPYFLGPRPWSPWSPSYGYYGYAPWLLSRNTYLQTYDPQIEALLRRYGDKPPREAVTQILRRSLLRQITAAATGQTTQKQLQDYLNKINAIADMYGIDEEDIFPRTDPTAELNNPLNQAYYGAIVSTLGKYRPDIFSYHITSPLELINYLKTIQPNQPNHDAGLVAKEIDLLTNGLLANAGLKDQDDRDEWLFAKSIIAMMLLNPNEKDNIEQKAYNILDLTNNFNKIAQYNQYDQISKKVRDAIASAKDIINHAQNHQQLNNYQHLKAYLTNNNNIDQLLNIKVSFGPSANVQSVKQIREILSDVVNNLQPTATNLVDAFKYLITAVYTPKSPLALAMTEGAMSKWLSDLYENKPAALPLAPILRKLRENPTVLQDLLRLHHHAEALRNATSRIKPGEPIDKHTRELIDELHKRQNMPYLYQQLGLNIKF